MERPPLDTYLRFMYILYQKYPLKLKTQKEKQDMSLWSLITGAKPLSAKQALETASTTADCINVFKKLIPGDPLEKVAAEKVVKLSPTAETLWSVLNQVPVDGVLGLRVLDRLLETMRTFSEARRLFNRAAGDAHLTKYSDGAMRKMNDTAQTKEELLVFLGYLSMGDENLKSIEDRLLPHLKTRDDWEEVARTLPGSRLAMLGAEKRLLFASTAEDIVELVGDLPADNPSRTILIEKLRTMELPVDEWREVFENASRESELESLALNKVLTLGSFDDLLGLTEFSLSEKSESLLLAKLQESDVGVDRWKEVLENDDKGEKVAKLAFKKTLELGSLDDFIWLFSELSLSDEEEKAVLGKVESLDLEKGDWERLRDDSETNSSLELLVWKKLLGFASPTTEDRIKFYRDYKDSFDVNSNVEQIILERIFALATLSECRLIALLATDEDYSELQQWAEKRAAEPEEVR